MNTRFGVADSTAAYSSIAGAITGIVLWVLQTYAFKGNDVPAPLEGACWVLIPAIVTGVSAFFTRNAKPPSAPQK